MVAARRARARDLIGSPPRLSVSTRALPAQQAADLLALLHGRRDVVAWVRHGRGLVGWGRVLTLEAEGAGRIEELRAALALTRHGAGISAVLSNAVRRTR